MPAIDSPEDAALEVQVRDTLFKRAVAGGAFSRILVAAKPAHVDKQIWDLAWASAREFEAVKATAESLALQDKVISLAPGAPQ